MDEIILALAPTGPFGKKHRNPISPTELIQTAADCYGAGASIIHLHARDLQGNLTTDMTLLQETFAGIVEQTGLLIEASTGGLSDFTAEQRGLPTTVPGADMGSLNLGSLNFGDEVYRNTPPAVDFWIEQMAPFSVKPSLEIFDTAHLAFARALIDEGKLLPPYNFSFIFNVRWGMVFSPDLLKYLLLQLPPKANWGVILVGSQNFDQHLAAADCGADLIRVGFEDSAILDGRLAESNEELVSALRRELEKRSFSILRGEAVRQKLLSPA
jgi:3-keto-5-aminohexanoate cleavage enzyme